jgi:hypothetical protein
MRWARWAFKMVSDELHGLCHILCSEMWAYIPRVNWLVIEYLRTRCRLGPKGGSVCLWCPNKIWILLLVHLMCYKINQNRIKLKKWCTQSRGGQELKENSSNATKASSQTSKKKINILLCCYESSKMISRTSRDIPIAI